MRHERVVDANVVVKLFVDEELSAEARKFFRSGRLIAYVPDLLYIECTNILWKRIGGGICRCRQLGSTSTGCED